MSAHRTNHQAGCYQGDLTDIDGRLWRYLFARAIGLTAREARAMLVIAAEAEWEDHSVPWCYREVCLSNKLISAETGITLGNLAGSGGAIAALIGKGWLTVAIPHTPTHPAHYRIFVGPYRLADYETVTRDYH